MIKTIICLFLFFFFSFSIESQAGLPEPGISANLSIGGSMSKLSITSISSFKLIGIRAGGHVNATFKGGHQLSIGLLYHQTGEAPDLQFFGNPDHPNDVQLHTVSLPVLLRYQFVQRPDINAVSLGLGPVFQRTFAADYMRPAFPTPFDQIFYNPFSWGLRVELQYRLTSHSSLSLGYERILSTVVNDRPTVHSRDLKNTSWNLMYDYHF